MEMLFIPSGRQLAKDRLFELSLVDETFGSDGAAA